MEPPSFPSPAQVLVRSVATDLSSRPAPDVVWFRLVFKPLDKVVLVCPSFRLNSWLVTLLIPSCQPCQQVARTFLDLHTFYSTLELGGYYWRIFDCITGGFRRTFAVQLDQSHTAPSRPGIVGFCFLRILDANSWGPCWESSSRHSQCRWSYSPLTRSLQAHLPRRILNAFVVEVVSLITPDAFYGMPSLPPAIALGNQLLPCCVRPAVLPGR